jgi:hypothetical protein
LDGDSTSVDRQDETFYYDWAFEQKNFMTIDTLNILSVGTMDGLVMVGDLVGRTDGKLEGIVLGANKKNKKKATFVFRKQEKKDIISNFFQYSSEHTV